MRLYAYALTALLAAVGWNGYVVAASQVEEPECSYSYHVNWFQYDWADQWATRVVVMNLSHDFVAHVVVDVIWDKDHYEFELQPRERLEHVLWIPFVEGDSGYMEFQSDQELAVDVVVWGVCDGNQRMTDVAVHEKTDCPVCPDVVVPPCPEIPPCPACPACPEIPECPACPDVTCCNSGCDCDEVNPPRSDYDLLGGPHEPTHAFGWATNGEYEIRLMASNGETTWKKDSTTVCSKCLEGPASFHLYYDLTDHSATSAWVEVERLGECSCDLAPPDHSFQVAEPLGSPEAECAYFGATPADGLGAFYMTKCGLWYEVTNEPYTDALCGNGQAVSHSTACNCPSSLPQ